MYMEMAQGPPPPKKKKSQLYGIQDWNICVEMQINSLRVASSLLSLTSKRCILEEHFCQDHTQQMVRKPEHHEVYSQCGKRWDLLTMLGCSSLRGQHIEYEYRQPLAVKLHERNPINGQILHRHCYFTHPTLFYYLCGWLIFYAGLHHESSPGRDTQNLNAHTEINLIQRASLITNKAPTGFRYSVDCSTLTMQSTPQPMRSPEQQGSCNNQVKPQQCLMFLLLLWPATYPWKLASASITRAIAQLFHLLNITPMLISDPQVYNSTAQLWCRRASALRLMPPALV